MIALTCSSSTPVSDLSGHDMFLAMLPHIRQQAAVAFRFIPGEHREELVQEVIANAYVAFARLVQRGMQAVAYTTPLAMYGVKQVRSGWRVGSRFHKWDVMSPAHRHLVASLDRFDQREGRWKEVLVEDRHAGPAATAVARLDFGQWFRSLSPRQRRIAMALASGETTTATARQFQVTAGRVSQLRQELKESWGQFQGETPVA